MEEGKQLADDVVKELIETFKIRDLFVDSSYNVIVNLVNVKAGELMISAAGRSMFTFFFHLKNHLLDLNLLCSC